MQALWNLHKSKAFGMSDIALLLTSSVNVTQNLAPHRTLPVGRSHVVAPEGDARDGNMCRKVSRIQSTD